MIISSAAACIRRPAVAAVLLIAIIVLLVKTLNISPTGVRHYRKQDETAALVHGVTLNSIKVQTPGQPDSFDHQLKAHVLNNAVHQRQCHAIPSWLIQSLANEVQLTPDTNPLIYHFHNGRPVTDTFRRFRVGVEFCSVIFAPQSAPANATRYENLPIEGWGPDSIHAEIASDDIRLIWEHPDYWGTLTVPNAIGGDAVVLAVYKTSYALNQPGTYQTIGEVEFQNYDWVMEDPIDVTQVDLPYNMTNIQLLPRSPTIEIYGNPLPRPTNMCYHNGFNNVRGRWYRASSFGRDGNQTKLESQAHLEFADHNTTTDEWGWTFAPDECNLGYFSPEDHVSCLESKTIQVLGDSNSRRVFKSIVSGGIAWCQDTEDPICQCEDHFQTEFYDVYWNEINASRFRDVFMREDPTPFGKDSKIYFDFVGGSINPKLFNHWPTFFNAEENKPSIVSQRIATHGAIDVVHVSLLGWDMAAIRTPREVLASLPTLRETLLNAYPNGTRFVHRLANNMCCGNQNHRTRYSAPRFKMWNAMWQAFWAPDEEAGRAHIVDPSALQGRRDAETKFHCPTTHLRGSHVRLEQMMWMTAVCDKNSDGTVAMRNDFGL